MNNKKKNIIMGIKLVLSGFLSIGIIFFILGLLLIIDDFNDFIALVAGLHFMIFGIIIIPIAIMFIKDFTKATKKTIRRIVIVKSFNDIQKAIFEWFKLNNFKIEKSKNNLIIAIKITTDFFGLTIHRIFKINLEKENKNRTLLHGEFYILSSNMKDIPLSLTNRRFCFGGKYRNETFNLMENLLSTLKN
ncbi:MAG: hypothetical protein JSV49_10940 [Thermoplasmata archaeon]|nr:MAG: hypothetical protein JSV49_10940 [Thermoplasmata archaeon]